MTRFKEFIESFQYEYDAIAKDPAPTQAAWVERNKRKIFLGRFASRNLQKDYEDAVTEGERSNLTFTEMVSKLQARYRPTRNYTNERFDVFVNRIKHEAESCQFKCANDTCNDPSIMIRDQIVIGTTNAEIRNKALKNQWELDDLVKHGRQLEAATHSAQRIVGDKADEQPISCVKKPGRYSKKWNKNVDENRNQKMDCNNQCQNCSSRSCQGNRKCQAYHLECFNCHKKGHFRRAKICKFTYKKRNARRVESNSDTSSSESQDSDSSSDSSVTGEQGHQKVNRFKHSSATNKHITKIRRMRCKKYIQRTSKKPRYQVEIVIKETAVTAFEDTGADICVMSLVNAKSIDLPLTNTKIKIRPYGSKSIKCAGFYEGTVMHGQAVANIKMYVVDQQLEMLLSGRVCEALGIIKFNSEPAFENAEELIRRTGTSQDEHTAKVIQRFPNVFTGIGKLKDHTIHIHIDESVPPIAAPARPIPFHLRERFDNEIMKMQEAGIIENHEGPAPWIYNVVLAPKDNGGMRITVDMRAANRAIRSTNIPIPRAEDIRVKLASAKYFSKLDFKSAFHQLEIEESSRYITVFHAGNRLKRYRRLTMGAKPASGELTNALLPLFGNIAGVHVIHG